MSWQTVVERTVVGLGYDLVEVEHGAGGLLRVTLDRQADDPAGAFVTVDDCERVTRQLQHVLEVEGCDYSRLEVSSPGLDRPLRKEADYLRFAGELVAVTLKAPFQGRKRFQGQLLVPETEGGPWRLALGAAPVPASKTARGGKAAKAAAAAARPDAEAAPEQALEFRLDEVRDARLVPVVDFKGRRFLPAETQAEGAAPQPVATPTDGESEQ